MSPSVVLEGRLIVSSLPLLTVCARGPVNRVDLVSLLLLAVPYSPLSFDRMKLKSPPTFGNEDDTKGDIACRPTREFVAVAELELDSLAVRKDDA